MPAQDAERLELGMSHQEIGGFLCHFWGFPESLAEAIALHHADIGILRKQKDTNPITNVVNISCRLAYLPYINQLDSDKIVMDVGSLDKEFLAYHQLDPETLAAKANDVYNKANESMADLIS